jgi:hypothetical protein
VQAAIPSFTGSQSVQISNPKHEILNKGKIEFDSSHPNANAQNLWVSEF